MHTDQRPQGLKYHSGLSVLQHHSSKASILWCSAFFTVQLLHPNMTTGKTIALTRWTFVGKVMSLLFNMLSRLVITFLPRRLLDGLFHRKKAWLLSLHSLFSLKYHFLVSLAFALQHETALPFSPTKHLATLLGDER